MSHCSTSASPRHRERDRSPSPRRSPARSPGRSPVRRSPSPKRGGGGSGSNENTGNNLYVAGMSLRTTEEELERRFAKFGKVLDCRLVRDPRTDESRGFGFVTMETSDQADECIKELHRTDLDGRIVTVEKAKRGRPRTPTPGSYLGRDPRRRDDRGGGGHRDSRYGGYDRYDSRRSPRGYGGDYYSRDRYRDRSPRDRRDRSRSPRRDYR